MAVRGLNHLTLAVSDLDRSLAFYRDALGMDVRAVWPQGAYLEAGALWLCLSLNAAPVSHHSGDYTHFAFDVAEAEFESTCEKVLKIATRWQDNRSEGRSFYVLDPDGHKLELHVGNLSSRLAQYRANPLPGMTIIGE
jgi:catechol 2,3-dioxygenase-like lactoylglutathione lyase family enzyme